MNQMYGFEGEVKAKYTAQMFQLFSEVFQWLPLAQCINSKVLVSRRVVGSKHRPGQKILTHGPRCLLHLCNVFLTALHRHRIWLSV